MNKRIRNYIKFINEYLSCEHSVQEFERMESEHLVRISFFQHERLVHLLVTLAFALMTVGCTLVIVITGYIYLLGLLTLFMILLIPYIWHYYVLENGVQEMYRQYDEMEKKI